MSIAVIIPAYNSMKYFKETLDSVMSQTLPADEIIVVDDGSSDESAAFAESYGAPVKVFRRSNQRQAASRNFGAEQAASEWVAFLDHDDLWAPDKLEQQRAELLRHPKADVCYTGRKLLTQSEGTFSLGETVYTPPAAIVEDILYEEVCFLPSSVMVRRSAFLAAGGFDTKFRYVEDWDLWLRLLHSGSKFVECPDGLMIYRVHDNNASLASLAQLDEVMEVYRRHIRPTRAPYFPRFISRFESQCAYGLRRGGAGGYLGMMVRSLVHWPFGEPIRYKILLHMTYTTAKRSFAPPVGA